MSGDQHGIGSVLDIDAGRPAKKRHLMVPRAAAKALQPEDLQYLKLKGCFSLPDPDICKALIHSYFQFVHPGFPVVDAPAFLHAYANVGVQGINLLLLWSMFSVSASVRLRNL